jgi:hypothetical protein
MLDTVCKKIDLALGHLRARQLPPNVRLDRFCRTLGEALRQLEISPTTTLACMRAIRTRVEQVQALERPHALETVRALVLEVLQDVPETADLFRAGTRLPGDWSRRADRGRMLPEPHAPELGAERRIKSTLSYSEFRGFQTCPTMRFTDAYHSLDARAMNRHLRHLARHPRRPEPPGDFRGMSHV